MKKLLAIAVAVAFTAPAMADTSVYGKGHVSVNKQSGKSLDMQNHSSRIGFKGSNALDNGLTATHKFELGINLTEGGGLSSRDTWVGLKGGFGEVRFGRHTLPSDCIDDHADFMTNGGGVNPFEGAKELMGFVGRQNNVMAYVGAFGPLTVALAHIADGTRGTIDKANDIALAYKAGPFKASLGHVSPDKDDVDSLTGLGLSYSGANYGIGFKHDKKGDNKQNTLSGKYSFGKAYVAAEYGKVSDSKRKSQIIEIGYKLGKNTKVYFENSKQSAVATIDPNTGNVISVGDVKNNRIGLEHSF